MTNLDNAKQTSAAVRKLLSTVVPKDDAHEMGFHLGDIFDACARTRELIAVLVASDPNTDSFNRTMIYLHSELYLELGSHLIRLRKTFDNCINSLPDLSDEELSDEEG